MDYFFRETVIIIEFNILLIFSFASAGAMDLLVAFFWSSSFICLICMIAILYKDVKRSMTYNLLVPTGFNVALFAFVKILYGRYLLDLILWVACRLCFCYFFYMDYFKLETKIAADRALNEAKELDAMVNDVAAAETSRRMKNIERDRALQQAFEVVIADPVCSQGNSAAIVLQHIKSNYTAYLPEIVRIGDTVQLESAPYRIRIFSDRFGNVAEIVRG